MSIYLEWEKISQENMVILESSPFLLRILQASNQKCSHKMLPDSNLASPLYLSQQLLAIREALARAGAFFVVNFIES